MAYFVFLLMLLAGSTGLYLGMLGFREYKSITRTAAQVSGLQIVKMAAAIGISSSLIFFAIIAVGSLINNEYVWSLPKLGSSILVALLPGVVVTLGSAYQIYTTVIFRDMLIRKYKVKVKSEQHNE